MKPSYDNRLNDAAIRMMDCDSKVGVLATEDENGYPHLFAELPLERVVQAPLPA